MLINDQRVRVFKCPFGLHKEAGKYSINHKPCSHFLNLKHILPPHAGGGHGDCLVCALED